MTDLSTIFRPSSWLTPVIVWAGFLAAPLAAQDISAQDRIAASASQSLGGPASVAAQQELDRLRRLEDSRLPGWDRALDPIEFWWDRLQENTGLNLSFDYQTLYQKSSNSLTNFDDAASGQLRILGNWTLLNRGGDNPGSFVFILENRHKLGIDKTPSELPGEIGYSGVTGLTFGDGGNILSVAYWSQALNGGAAGFVAGRIDPGDYSDILGHVNPRTTFSNFAIMLNPVLPIPDPGFGISGGGFITDQVYALGLVSDANGSLTDVEWFPGGSEFYSYGEIGWTPSRSKRYLTNVHVGAFHVDERQTAGVPATHGIVLSANHTFENNVMVFGRLGWSEGGTSLARRAVNGGFIWASGIYDDLFGFGVTVADLSDTALQRQTTVEAFYRLDVSDNVALTADVQYLKKPGTNPNDPLVFGLRLRFNL